MRRIGVRVQQGYRKKVVDCGAFVPMGRQFNFFLAPGDERSFEEALRKAGDAVFLAHTPGSSRPSEVPTSVVPRMGEEYLRIFLVRRHDLDHVEDALERREAPSRVLPVIEFDRCYRVTGLIRRGRLWFETRYFDDDGSTVRKTEDFIRWAERLFRFGKLALKRTETGDYAGASALRGRGTKWKFEGIDAPVRMSAASGPKPDLS